MGLARVAVGVVVIVEPDGLLVDDLPIHEVLEQLI